MIDSKPFAGGIVEMHNGMLLMPKMHLIHCVTLGAELNVGSRLCEKSPKVDSCRQTRLPGHSDRRMNTRISVNLVLIEFGVNDVRILMPIINVDPHL